VALGLEDLHADESNECDRGPVTRFG